MRDADRVAMHVSPATLKDFLAGVPTEMLREEIARRELTNPWDGMRNGGKDDRASHQNSGRDDRASQQHEWEKAPSHSWKGKSDDVQGDAWGGKNDRGDKWGGDKWDEKWADAQGDAREFKWENNQGDSRGGKWENDREDTWRDKWENGQGDAFEGKNDRGEKKDENGAGWGNVSCEDSTKLFVGNIPADCDDDAITEFFSMHGFKNANFVKKIVPKEDSNSNHSGNAYAFVRLPPQDAERAASVMDRAKWPSQFRGRDIFISCRVARNQGTTGTVASSYSYQ